MLQKRSFLVGIWSGVKLTIAVVLLCLLVPGSALAQSTALSGSSPQVKEQPATPSQTAAPPASGSPVSDSETNGKPEHNAGQPAVSEPETRITKSQAKELFRSVDEILRFVSQETGLPIEHKVKRNLITRESVEQYVSKRMKDDKDAQRLEQSRLVLIKFGLLPAGYDLHAEFLRLLGEQVAAYYDPKSRSVNLLDWVPPDTQKPVLAHELTHALQDQKVGLEKWELAGAKDDKPLPDQQEYVVEEAQAARQCVTEGQAMVALFDYSLAPLGKTVLTAPELVDAMNAGMSDSKDSPIFAAAPMFLRESLMLPYTFGTDFVRTVLTNRGKDAAFDGMLQNPPIDTRQIMQPETYLLGQVVAAPIIPDLDRLVAPNYERFDFGGMGEFDVYLLARQYSTDDAKNYYSHWHGGYYFAAHLKAAPKDQIAMLYFSQWDTPEAARAFAKLYAGYLPKRYTKAAVRPGSRQDAYAFDTEQGKATVEVQENEVLVLEGYDDDVAEKARGAFFYGMSLPAAAKVAH